MKMKLTKKRLINAGYKEWKTNHFQKCFREYHKTYTSKRYFIDLKYYDIKFNNTPRMKGFTIKVQFQNTMFNKKDICYNINFESGDLSIKEIEKFVEDQWINLNKPYYEEQC